MEPLRIANCSGFYGDRLSAAREMVTGGEIDYLTGDYLAELTMALLWKSRLKHGDNSGYARSFLAQMEDVMGECLERGVGVVVNAGGLNPRGLTAGLEEVASRLGLSPTIAAVDGDDLMDRLDEVGLVSYSDGTPLADAGLRPVTANAYLGCWGIVRALEAGADIVVTGRVTDAALAMAPAAHHFGWVADDWDRLAGALVAGHVIECGTQTTGGNFSFFDEVPDLDRIGFPLVEMAADGSFVVTKHPDSGGLVSVETVTAQLLYEIGGHRYPNPDVTARFDTIRIGPAGTDRVEVSGVKGEPPPSKLKVAVNYPGGYKNRVTFVLTGLDIDLKAAAVEKALWRSVGGSGVFASTHVELIRDDRPDPATNNEAMARLRVTVSDPDPDKVGRRFSAAAVELALASYPGFFLTDPPGNGSPFAVYWPASVDRNLVPSRVTIAGETVEVSSASPDTNDDLGDVELESITPDHFGPTVAVPLGRVAGARSGDKGGDANVGVWVRDRAAYAWLEATLTADKVAELLGESPENVERHRFPNLGALNFVVRGLLGDGVSSSPRVDPQAKSLGEFLRARFVEVPTAYLGSGSVGGGPDAGTIPSGA